MSQRLPPRLATRLLQGLGSGYAAEALIGDLEEQFAAGRSTVWYWREAVGALGVDLLQILRTHALSFTAAVLAGCALTSLWLLANSLAFQSVYDSLDTSRHLWNWDTFLRFMGLRAAQASITVLVFVSCWIVTRIHRAHQRAVLLVFTIVLTAQHVPELSRLVMDGVRNSRLPEFLIPDVVQTSIQAVFTLVCGLWVIRTERFADMDRRTRFVTFMTIVLTLVCTVLYDAWKVGALNYPAAERYPVDAAEIASGAYLASLLWRQKHDQVSHC